MSCKACHRQPARCGRHRWPSRGRARWADTGDQPPSGWRIAARCAPMPMTSSESGTPPAIPGGTALSLPWPLPVAPSEPQGAARAAPRRAAGHPALAGTRAGAAVNDDGPMPILNRAKTQTATGAASQPVRSRAETGGRGLAACPALVVSATSRPAGLAAGTLTAAAAPAANEPSAPPAAGESASMAMPRPSAQSATSHQIRCDDMACVLFFDDGRRLGANAASLGSGHRARRRQMPQRPVAAMKRPNRGMDRRGFSVRRRSSLRARAPARRRAAATPCAGRPRRG